MPKNRKPDFIGIGPPRTASTWIFESICQHPQIYQPKIKETLFFAKNNHKGSDWYESFFKNQPTGKLTGEYSSQYFAYKKSPQKIWKAYPNIKLICCLRNPIDRAFSFYFHRLRLYRINNKQIGFEQSLSDDLDKILTTGNYATHLKRYWQYFKKEQILVLFYDDLLKNPTNFIQTIFNFLEIDSNYIPPKINKKINHSRIPRSKFIDGVSVKVSISRENNNVLANLLLFLENIGAREIIAKLNSKNIDVHQLLKAETKTQLKKYYQKEIEEVEKIFNRDLSHWL